MIKNEEELQKKEKKETWNQNIWKKREEKEKNDRIEDTKID